MYATFIYADSKDQMPYSGKEVLKTNIVPILVLHF